jgi:hypothetical protein
MLVPAGTEVKFLSEGDGVAFRVRLLSGTHEGQTGWALYRQVRHTGPDTRPFPPPIDEDPGRPSSLQSRSEPGPDVPPTSDVDAEPPAPKAGEESGSK